MSMTRPKIASIVASQVPAFVREDYATFIAFLEAYYEYLDTLVEIDLKTIRDIDETLDSFIQYFKKEVSTNIPYTVVNERFLLSHMKDQYLAKGSEASFKLLFRLLFNKEVTIEYPSTQILRASDGKWNQDISVFAKINLGTPDMIVGELVTILAGTNSLNVFIDRKQDVEVKINNIVQISTDTFEFFIDRKYLGIISINDQIQFNNEFNATIIPTTSNLIIQQGGKNFKVGQLYEIFNGSGIGSIIKVTAIDSNGGIKTAEFIKYGVGYLTDFTTTFLTDVGQVLDGSTINIVGLNIGISDIVSGFNEQGYINKVDYAMDAWDGTYAGETLREFSNTTTSIVDASEPAVIKIIIGAVAKYPGYFRNNDGFISDAMYIQDSKYYQAFAYVIKIDERLDDYRSAVKTLIHPAGMALFGEYGIRNSFDIDVTIETLNSILILALQDIVSFDDVLPTFAIGKALDESVTQIDEPTISFDKYIVQDGSDSITQTEGGYVVLNPYSDLDMFGENYVNTQVAFT